MAEIPIANGASFAVKAPPAWRSNALAGLTANAIRQQERNQNIQLELDAEDRQLQQELLAGLVDVGESQISQAQDRALEERMFDQELALQQRKLDIAQSDAAQPGVMLEYPSDVNFLESASGAAAAPLAELQTGASQGNDDNLGDGMPLEGPLPTGQDPADASLGWMDNYSGPYVKSIPVAGAPGLVFIPNPDGKTGRFQRVQVDSNEPSGSSMTFPHEQSGLSLDRVTVGSDGKQTAEYKPSTKQDAQDEKLIGQALSEITKAKLVTEDVDRIVELADSASLPATGKLSNWVAALPVGTNADTIRRMLDSITADVAFSTLAEMRKNSPTGGALGAVSERELALLAAAAGSLDPALPKEVFLENLKRYKEMRMDMLNRWEQSLSSAQSKTSAAEGTRVAAPPKQDLEQRAQQIRALASTLDRNSQEYQALLQEYSQIRALQKDSANP